MLGQNPNCCINLFTLSDPKQEHGTTWNISAPN